MNGDIFDQLTQSDEVTDEVPEDESHEVLQQEASYTPVAVKQCCQELLRSGLVEMERKPKLYYTALTHSDHIQRLLEPFDLGLQLDDIRGLAFLKVNRSAFDSEGYDEWSHPLVRRQRLTLEQSLLLAILRKRFLNHEQEAGVGAVGAKVFVDDLIPELQIYLNELGSDAKEQSRVRNLLEKLKGHGIVSEIDNQDQITIRPIIAHFADPENLMALLQQFKRLAETDKVDV